jgi:hypothetical protein
LVRRWSSRVVETKVVWVCGARKQPKVPRCRDSRLGCFSGGYVDGLDRDLVCSYMHLLDRCSGDVLYLHESRMHVRRFFWTVSGGPPPQPIDRFS